MDVALAAIQGLNELVKENEERLAERDAELVATRSAGSNGDRGHGAGGPRTIGNAGAAVGPFHFPGNLSNAVNLMVDQAQ